MTVPRSAPSRRTASRSATRAVLTLIPALCAALSLSLSAAPDAEGQERDAGPALEPFRVWEASVVELQDALRDGRVTSVELVDRYLARIGAYDRRGPRLNSVLRINPEARSRAAELDRERAAGRVRGSLHGIPVVVKDNYDVVGMPTTASTLAMAGVLPPDDAFQVRKLQEAGAVILAKTNLHELASGITTVSSLGGQTRNPYDPFRNPGGSSGGTGAAVAASLAAVGWGSDTCGSIRIPAALNNLYGLRPTKGISSIDGIVPLSHSQDTGGPLARTVRDLAIALDATVGYDPADPATELVRGRTVSSFVDAVDEEGENGASLRGLRVGTLEPWLAEGPVTSIVRDALAGMEEAGAVLVPVELPEMEELLEGTSLIAAEFKWDLADYLSSVPSPPVDSLGDILDAGLHHEALDGVLRAWNRTTERNSEARREAEERQENLRRALRSLLTERNLDILAYPTLRDEGALIGQPATGSSCALSARSGLPAISVPAGFTEAGVPVGLELLGRPMDDQRLVAVARAWEVRAAPRRPPFRTPALDGFRAPDPVALPVAGSGASSALAGTITVDRAAGTVEYELSASDSPDDVHGITLERRGGGRASAGDGAAAGDGLSADDSPPAAGGSAPAADDRPRAVVERLGRPGEAVARGSLLLTPELHRDLTAGILVVGLYTTEEPLGAVRVSLPVLEEAPPDP